MRLRLRPGLAFVALLVAARTGTPLPAQPADTASQLRVVISLSLEARRLTKDDGGRPSLAERMLVGALDSAVAPNAEEPVFASDSAEDEVYMILAGRLGTQRPLAHVLMPAGYLPLTVPKLGFTRNRLAGRDELLMWDGTMREGAELELIIALVEFDGDGTYAQGAWGGLRGLLARSRPDSVRVVAEVLADRLMRGDSVAPGVIRSALSNAGGAAADDVIGAVRVRISVRDGAVRADWTPLDHARDRGHPRLSKGRPLKPRAFQLEGGDASYDMHFRVTARPVEPTTFRD